MESEELFSGFGWRVSMDSAPLPDGRIKKAARVGRCDTVHILAFPSPKKVILLREFRAFYGGYVWMLPTGRVNKETDQAAAAQRELQEESGFRAGQIRFYKSFYHSETFASGNHIYIATDLTKDPLPQDHDEMIEVHVFPYEEAITKALSGTHVHSSSVCGLLTYAREHPEVLR
ncbi:NUDIX hydrolase [Candidatus Peregrinibacteria bacterium]|nr:NUDIX hydrolase [Candidatus Peregrinibacteria bacterium]